MINLSALGKANIDVIVHVDEKFLPHHGLIKGEDNCLPSSNLWAILNKLKNFELNAGGSAANTACGFSQMGGCAAFWSSVGQDAAGNFYIRAFKKHNVQCFAAIEKSRPSSLCLCIIPPSGEITYAVPSDLVPMPNCKQVDWEKIKASDIVHLEGELAETDNGTDMLSRAAQTCRETGSLLSMVLPPIGRPECKHRLLQTNILQNVGIVFGNQAEYRAFFQSDQISELSILSQRDSLTMVITCGKKGGLAISNGEVSQVPAMPTMVNNPIGAGDNFSAAFLYIYKQTGDIENALYHASHLAAKVVRSSGSRLHLFGPRLT